MTTDFESLFAIKLTALAKLSRFDLDETILDLYDKGLSYLGYKQLCDVIDELIFSRDDRTPFPSVKTIKGKIILEANPEAEAIEAAARIVQAVNRIGYTNPDAAKEFIGELGWRAVTRFGGWLAVCETMTPENVTTMQAQFRQLSKATLSRVEYGLEEFAPVIKLALRPTEKPSLPPGTNDEGA